VKDEPPGRSANLTSHAIDAINAEIGAFVAGAAAARARALFEAWWNEASPLSEREIESAMRRQAQLAKRRRMPSPDACRKLLASFAG
jgi:hypothetical protein